MSRILLIGSRALHHHRPEREIKGKHTDYDFIATFVGALHWIATLKPSPTIQTIEYAFDRATHHNDIVKDLDQWKHLDKLVGAEIYNNQLNQLKCVKKIIGHNDEIKFEIEIAEKFSSGLFILDLIPQGEINNDGYEIASLPILEVIKTSHMIFPFNWRTHMADLDMMRKQLGRQENGSMNRTIELQRLMVHRRLEHYLRLGVPGSNINLNQSNEDFLENEVMLYVDKYIKHDDIHLRVMIDGVAPAYDKLRLDQNKAFMSRDLFMKAPLQVQLNCVREEVMAIALERYLLPDREHDAQKAYTKAYIRVCTTLTKGWFREQAIDVHHLVSQLDFDLMKVKNKIRDEYQKSVERAQLIEQNKADQIRSVKDILSQSFTRDLNYRLEYLLPIFFRDTKELKLAQLMAKNTTEMYNNSYTCYLPGRGIDMTFTAHTEYEYENGGWCECFNKWKAYIIAMPTQLYKQTLEDYDPLDPVERDLSLYSDHSDRQVLHDSIRLSFTMSTRADDSFDSSPSIDDLRTQKFSDLQIQNQSLTDQFLMKFILCLTYPNKFESGGQTAMPDSPIHYLYEIWRQNLNLPE